MSLKQIYLYILDNPDSDNITCFVPYRIDNEESFFGPCKKNIREEIRNMNFINRNKKIMDENIEHHIFFIGVNSSNSEKIRKILYVGKLSKVMTFELAYKNLTDFKYDKMRQHKKSPLHVKPLYKNELHFGYEHISEEHKEKDEWIKDLTSKNYSPCGKKIFAKYDAWNEFERDCCMILDNIFWADGKAKFSKKTLGIEFGEKNNLLELLKQAQDGKKIDKNAIFGYDSLNKPIGRPGGPKKNSPGRRLTEPLSAPNQD